MEKVAPRPVRFCTTSDGVRIAYWTVGTGSLLVRVSSPPFGLGAPEVYGRLSQQLTIVGFDLRGTGQSQRDVAEAGIETMLLDLQAVVDTLPAQAFTLDGVQLGGLAAIRYAFEHPERVSGLILSDTFARVHDAYALPRNRSFRALVADWDALTETAAANLWGEGRDQTKSHAKELRDVVDRDVALMYLQSLEHEDVGELLPGISAPALVNVHAGEGARFVALAQSLAMSLPNATFVTIPGQGGEGMAELDQAIGEFLGVGSQAAVGVDAGSRVKTVLFTDIVGHTEMMRRLGDSRGREVLRDHERITRETLSAHGGAEVKTDGDSFMATFASPSSAVECAIALQQAFAHHADAGGEPIVVRMGLNVGEPIEEDGDFFGSAVILAARIKEQAAGGEILVPEAVRHMLAGKGFVFGDRGEFVPKGFDEGVRVWEVRWRG